MGNIHFSITEQDLQNVFEPFGELEFVQLQKDDNGRSRGYGFVQYVLFLDLLFCVDCLLMTNQVPRRCSSPRGPREDEWI